MNPSQQLRLTCGPVAALPPLILETGDSGRKAGETGELLECIPLLILVPVQGLVLSPVKGIFSGPEKYSLPF